MTESDMSAWLPAATAPFSELDPSDRAALMATAWLARPDADGVLFRSGTSRAGLALLVGGTLEGAASAVSDGAFVALADHQMTETALWGRDVRASADAVALVLDDAALRRAYLQTPDAFRDVPACANASALQARLSAMLRNRSLFQEGSPALLEDLEVGLPVRFHDGGQRVFSVGDPSDHLLIVIAGMMRPSAPVDGDEARLLPAVGPGAAIGELGVVLGEPRSTDVTAVRDCESLVIDSASYDRLLREHPAEMHRTICRSIHDHLSRAAAVATVGDRPRTFAVVSLGAPALAAVAAEALMPAMSGLGRTGMLTHADNEAMLEMGRGVGTAMFNAIERSVDVMLYVADVDDETWTDRCLRQADHVLFIAEWDDDTALRPLEERLLRDRALSMKGHSLVVLHPAEAPRPQRAKEWRSARPGGSTHHMRQGMDTDSGRIARFLMGAAHGVVLGGGGARGFAHVGVLRALEQAGLPVDMVGGNSMGALIGAQFARGDALDAILEQTLAFARNGEYPTLPLISLIGGRRFTRALEAMFDGLAFDDLWTPFFTVACDLSAAEVSVLDSGPLYEGVLASNSPAGILPPFVQRGHLLVDGAILNNVPVDVMRARVGNGRVIAVDVNQRRDLIVEPDLKRLSAFEALKRMMFRRDTRLPNLQEILVRAGIVGGIAHRDRTRALADLYIEPPVSEFSLLSYGKAWPIAAAGEQAAAASLADWTP